MKKFIIIYIGLLIIYGFFSIINTMERLKQNPCVDLYANNLEFQIIAFMLTKGLFGILILFFILLTYKVMKDKNEEK